jgi:glycosyltransferase involved in cell wall biosynthesis
MDRKKKVLVLPEVYDEVHTGWPSAVVKKMYDLDKINFNYIRIQWILKREPKKTKIQIVISEFIKIWLVKYVHIYYKCIRQYLKIKKYNPYQYDIIISHDPIISFCLLAFFKDLKIIAIYHWQWSFYNELIDLIWVSPSKFLSNLLGKMESVIYKNAYKIWFPSIGAFDALLSTNPWLGVVLRWRLKDRVILYNWINLDWITLVYNPEFERALMKEWYKFVTISSFNEAKWVDRIPKFLGLLKRKWIKFSWIVIWSWKLSDRIKSLILDNDIKSETSLFEKWFPKPEILGLLSRTDFYVLFHRYSIFDLSTLEAMYFWVIPILSNVWWNKEVVNENNWLLLEEPFEDYTKLFNLIEWNNISKLKQINKNIVSSQFSERIFIETYRSLIND